MKELPESEKTAKILSSGRGAVIWIDCEDREDAIKFCEKKGIYFKNKVYTG